MYHTCTPTSPIAYTRLMTVVGIYSNIQWWKLHTPWFYLCSQVTPRFYHVTIATRLNLGVT